MNTTTARCGHAVPAEGSPNSGARRACEQRTCGKPRCESRLPAPKFTDAECEAYCQLHAMGIRGWLVDLATKMVHDDEEHEFPSLLSFLDFHVNAGKSEFGYIMARGHEWRKASPLPGDVHFNEPCIHCGRAHADWNLGAKLDCKGKP